MRRLEGYQKGVNLGGWLSQGSLTKEHLDTFITEKDIERIASWGADHVRLPLDYENVETEDGTDIEAGYRYIENCVSWCRKYHLNMVLDLHKTYGYIFDNQDYSKDFFHSRKQQERFLNLWRKLIKRFAKDADIIMFELLNEVVSFDVVDEWNDLSSRAVKIIRETAPSAKILYGGVGYNAVTSIKKLLPPADENIVYNFHCYEPLIFTHQSAYWVKDMPSDFHIGYPGSLEEYMRISRTIPAAMHGALADDTITFTKLGSEFFEALFEDAIQAAENFQVPLYCGEYGVIDQAPQEDTIRWFHDINSVFHKYGIGRAVWSYKEMDFGLTSSHYDSVRKELLENIFGN